MMEFVERLLQDAADRGTFDAGPSAGRPIRIDDGRPDWWVRRETALIAAEERAADTIRAVERALGHVWTLGSERAVRIRVRALNERLAEAGVADALLDQDEVVATWRRMAGLRIRGSGNHVGMPPLSQR